MMLSRTAEDLFWMGRYMERADNVARLLEAGRRLDAMASDRELSSNEWSAILIAAGCRDTFPGELEQAKATDAIHHMVLDLNNPSSLRSCFVFARGNGRAQRGSLSWDSWTAINEAWRDSAKLNESHCNPRYLGATLDQVRRACSLFRGTIEATMLRSARSSFIHLGKFIERADATARLLDVKYHVLLPDEHQVGSAFDQLQWNNLLRAAGARSAYRWVYHKPVHSRLVIDFLLLNSDSPRSFGFCIHKAQAHLEILGRDHGQQLRSLTQVAELSEDLSNMSVDRIISKGLHQTLTQLIIRSNAIAIAIGQDFGFRPSPQADSENTSQ